MKYRLGLDIGPNSIGWAVIYGNIDHDTEEVLYGIKACGSRIIPMDAKMLGNFDTGQSVSQTADKTLAHRARITYERCKLRRERLNRVLSLMGFLPPHYSKELDRYGKFQNGNEPKLAWTHDGEGNPVFIFQDSFEEMLEEFRLKHPGLIEGGKKIPYDWTIYYLRKKALSQPVTREELAWILHSFNQKRGYQQIRGEEEEKDDAQKGLCDMKVLRVENTGKKKGNKTLYNIYFEDGKVYEGMTATVRPEWEGTVKEVLVTKIPGKADKYEFLKEDDPNNWKYRKVKTQCNIDRTGQTVGSFIYEALLNDPTIKVRGSLVHTVDRKYYSDELSKILHTQKEFHPELSDSGLYQQCLLELYPNNDMHRNNLSDKDLAYLLQDDVIFYQRPLKSKKSLIANCSYEEHKGKDLDGKGERVYGVKCIARSHPLFQEFRLWQFVSNLRIYRKGELGDEDVTEELLPTHEDYAKLFQWLNDRKEISMKTFLGYRPFRLGKEADRYRWNYGEENKQANETRGEMLAYLKKAGVDYSFLTPDHEFALWQILYSVSDKEELRKSLETFAKRFGLDDAFVQTFCKFPAFSSDYGSYSCKAIKKLLPLMRCGSYWSEEAIDPATRTRIEKLLNGEWDEGIRQRVREHTLHLQQVEHFQGLPVWLASYVVYDRHSEAKEIVKWSSPDDIDTYLKSFRHHSLNNPIVETVVLEALRVVRDVWKQVERIDEIYIELGREMKKTAKERKEMTGKMRENEARNLRIKYLLTEFMNPEMGIENVRPSSPMQQDILRIYEEEVLENNELDAELSAIKKKLSETDASKRPTRAEVLRYKLWLDQKYCSPYTGKPIPLAKLFTKAYEIEHVIPRSRYFDDSYNNKVICETEVNKLKNNMLGHEFITKCQKTVVKTLRGDVSIFTIGAYEEFVRKHYAKNRKKMQNLLLDEIPDDFNSRQLNDTRYISKLVRTLLSNIVREEGEQESVSKHVISCTGMITDRLKGDWGLHDVWNSLVLPRFKRMNELTGTDAFTAQNSQGHEIPDMPLEYQKGFQKKRIDHRHHAMDAIVIACTSRNLINLLNNESARKGEELTRKDLLAKLCVQGSKRVLKKPWDTFTQDVRQALQEMVVTFKQNRRVLTKGTNYYTHYGEDGKKHLAKQEKGDGWVVRKPLHEPTLYGEVNLRSIKTVSLKDAISKPQAIVEKDFKRKLMELIEAGWDIKKIKDYFEGEKDLWHELNLSKIKVYCFSKEEKEKLYATRKALDETFDAKKIQNQITDTGIQKILLRHLEQNGNNPKQAFSPEGIEEMNRNIQALNGGRPHQPIKKVRVYEAASGRFAVGKSGVKASQFTQAKKGTNLFFAVYEKEVIDKKTQERTKERDFQSIPLKDVVERLKQGLPPAAEELNGSRLLFTLSPNDLVYLPTAEELERGELSWPIDKKRIYKMVSSTGPQCFFIQSMISKVLIDKLEFSTQNKMEKAITGEMIKKTCVPIKVDRLGNIISIQY